jgi:hypothetical protein
MHGYIRWGSIAAMIGGLALWFRRSRRQRKINPESLGSVSQQWFMDRRHDL